MELKTCTGCDKVFLGKRDREFCPLCAVIQISRETFQRQHATADTPQTESRAAMAGAR